MERSVREVNRLLGEYYVPLGMPLVAKQEKIADNSKKSILSIQSKHLNPNHELKKIFGAKIIQAEQ